MPYEIVYSRHMGQSASRASSLNVRSVINITDTLEDAFRIALDRLKEIEMRVSHAEHPYSLQVWHYGQLLALARLYRPSGDMAMRASPYGAEQNDGSLLYAHWLRTPTPERLLKWEVDLDMAISFGGHNQDIDEVWTEDNAKEVLLDLLLTKNYAAHTDSIYKVLYKVERERGSSRCISVHLENDLGM